MIPIGAIGVVVAIIARAALNAGKAREAGAASPRVRMISRATVPRFQQPAGFRAFCWLAVAPLSFGATMGAVYSSWWFLPAAAIGWALVFPWPLARLFAIPLGLVRTSYFLAHLSDWTWRADKPGGPAFAAAWALVRRRRPSEKAAAWIETKLSADRGSLQGSTVAAAALVAGARGEVAESKRLFEGLFEMDPRVIAPVVWRVALEYLAADAAAQANWARVRELAEHPRAGRLVLLLGAAARRLWGGSLSPSDAELWTRWLTAPRRLKTWSLVRRALAVGHRGPRSVNEVREPSEPVLEPLPRALWLHQQLLLGRLEGGQVGALARVGAAWDELFVGQDFTRAVEARALSLGGADPTFALRRLREWVEADLVARAEAGEVYLGGLDEPPALLASAAQRRRDKAFGDLELAVRRLGARVEERRELPAIDEWREFNQVRVLHRALVASGGLEARRLAYATIQHDVCDHGVWLFNAREEYPLANAIFRWLLAEALAIGDDEATKLQRKNTRCGL